MPNLRILRDADEATHLDTLGHSILRWPATTDYFKNNRSAEADPFLRSSMKLFAVSNYLKTAQFSRQESAIPSNNSKLKNADIYSK